MDNKLKDKMNRCRFSHPSMRDIGACHCVVDGWEDEQVRTVRNSRAVILSIRLPFRESRTKGLIRKVSGIHVALYAKFGHAGRNTRERHILEFTWEICQLVFRLPMTKIQVFCATIP